MPQQTPADCPTDEPRPCLPIRVTGRGTFDAIAIVFDDGTVSLRVNQARNLEFWLEILITPEQMAELFNRVKNLKGE